MKDYQFPANRREIGMELVDRDGVKVKVLPEIRGCRGCYYRNTNCDQIRDYKDDIGCGFDNGFIFKGVDP